MYIILFIILLEGEESDKEDDNDDADKQMGDTDNAAEKYVYYITLIHFLQIPSSNSNSNVNAYGYHTLSKILYLKNILQQ